MQNQLENKVYAGFFVRLIAYAIDSMIAALIVGIVKLPFSIASGSAGFLKSNFIFDYSVLDVFTYVGIAAYFVLLTYFSHSTLGKKLFRLQVVTKNEEWTFINILYRETIGRFLSSIMCIGYLAIVVTKQKQGFHDMLSDTYVVYTNMMPATEKRLAAATADGSMADAPVYHSASAFELPESHPISVETPQKQEEERVAPTEDNHSGGMN